MAVTPGSATILNTLSGVSSIISFTNSELETLGTRVFEKGLLFSDEAGKLYLSDGVTALNALQPIVDTEIDPLTKNMRQALDNTFSGEGGVYKATEGGFVVLDAAAADGNPKINDKQLNLVDANGHLVAEYLKTVLTDENGVVLLDKLPDQMRRHMVFVNKYSEIAGLDASKKLDLIFVADASDDPSGTVTSGWAIYAFNVTDGAATGDPIKISEGEGLDIDLNEIASTYENVQAAGAVMYDHTVYLKAPTLTEFASLIDAAESYEPVDIAISATPADYTGTSGTEVPCGLTLSGTRVGNATVKLTGTGCTLKDGAGEAVAELTKVGTISEINSWLGGVSVVCGDSAGSVEVTVDTDTATRTITVNGSPAA